MSRPLRHTIVASALCLVASAAGAQPGLATAPPPVPAGDDAVTTWSANAGKAALAACIAPLDNPLHESRLYAMTHVAIHDALNAIDRRAAPYALDIRGPRSASPEAAVAAAAHGVLVPLLGELPASKECQDAGVASVEADYAAALLAIADGPARTQGLRVGRAAAAAILAVRGADGADTPVPDFDYPQGTTPGAYRFTPGFAFAFAPGWSNVTPFVLRDSAQFRPGRPYRVAGRRYARDLAEVKRLGGDGVTTPSARSEDQTEIARFWLESSPLAWNRIARTVSAARGVGLWDNARLFGLLNTALADGYIGSFATKYQDNFWRPVSAIRAADDDGNPTTVGDPTWTPLETTPPIPDHDSAHAVEGAAAATVMRRFFGTDRIRFETCSLTLVKAEDHCTDPSPETRSYDRLSDAAVENGLSRIYIGFHFRRAVVAGLEHGRAIGDRAVDRFLLPVTR